MYDVLSLFDSSENVVVITNGMVSVLMENDGLNVIDMHTSGHADKQSIKKLMYSVSPKEIIYVHTNKKGENVDGLQ